MNLIKDRYIYLMDWLRIMCIHVPQRMNLQCFMILWHQQVKFVLHLNKYSIYLIDCFIVVFIHVPQRMNLQSDDPLTPASQSFHSSNERFLHLSDGSRYLSHVFMFPRGWIRGSFLIHEEWCIYICVRVVSDIHGPDSVDEPRWTSWYVPPWSFYRESTNFYKKQQQQPMGAKVQSDAVQWRGALWVRVELSGGGGQPLVVGGGVNREAAVAAAPVVAVGGKTDGGTTNKR